MMATQQTEMDEAQVVQSSLIGLVLWEIVQQQVYEVILEEMGK